MLEKILEYKRSELEQQQRAAPLERFIDQIPEQRSPDFRESLQSAGPAIIAEIKYASPSSGSFDVKRSPAALATAFAENGAAALSVLTDRNFFQGSISNIREARNAVDLPVLRKDFIIDRYQIYEARLAGASACLLMVACLDDESLRELIELTRSLEMTPLVEVRDEQELERALEAGATTIGVNNRNLQDLSVDLDRARRLAERLRSRDDCVGVCESGIENRDQIEELHQLGYHAFLIGSALMRANDPGAALAALTGER